MRLQLALAVVLSLSACDDHGGDASGTGREPDEYVGCGTDELWPIFSDTESHAVTSDSEAAQVSAPTEGGTVSGKLLVEWRISAATAGSADGDVPASCAGFNRGFITQHLPPISGNAYDLTFTVDGKVDHRVITTLQRYSPSDDKQAAWKGKQVTLDIVRLVVLRNDPKEGPFKPTKSRVFTIE